MKLILILLSLFIFTTPTTIVLAEEVDSSEEIVTELPTYETITNEDNTLTITKYNGNEEEVTIPETINNLKVTKLAVNSFNNDSIKTVIIKNALELEDQDNVFSHETEIITIKTNTNIKAYADKYLYEFRWLYRITYKDVTYYTTDYEYKLDFEIEPQANKKFIGYHDDNNYYYTQGETILINNDINLYPMYKNNTYMVFFDGNGGSGYGYKVSAPNNTNVKLPPNTYTKAGYKFVKWNTRPDGSGKSYYDSQVVNNLVTVDKGEITLFAIWGKQSNITLYNGSKKVKTLTVYKGIKVGTMPTVTKKGYTFTGWYTAKNGGTKIDANTLYNKDTNTKLYAQFKINTYNITYNLNGGINNTKNPTKYTYGKNVTIKKPTRVGYTFTGWYKNNKKVTKINGKLASNVVLEAKWTPIKYTIKYNANGGKGSLSASKNVKYDSLFTLKKNTFTKKGATFIGWTTNKEGTGTVYKDQGSVKNLRSTKGNITLYAKWKLAEYTITYNLNGGTNNANNPTKYTINSTINFAKPTKEGYFFQGWFTTPTFENNKPQIKSGSTGNITLYAKWAELKPELGPEPLRYYIVETARKEMGNVGGKKFWSWYGFNGRIAWCCIFVTWVANQNGVLGTAIPKVAGVSSMYSFFNKNNAYKKKGTYTPKPGDIIFFDWEGKGKLQHVGIVDKVENGKVYTLEGNSKGDTARAKEYPLNSKYIKGYGVPNYNV